MTVRAVVLGFLGAAFICGFTYFNDAVLRQTWFVGNTMPLSVFGGTVLFVLIVNPLLARISPRAKLSGKELAVALAMTLAACCIPGSGLMRTFTVTLILPHRYERANPGWQREKILQAVPKAMLVDLPKDKDGEDIVLNGFERGLSRSDVGLRDIPWYAWRSTLLFWMPRILILWIGLVGLALIVHRQWSEHEQLPYPIARFADSLLPRGGGVVGEVLRSRLFWLGLGLVLVFHLNNYCQTWFPSWVKIPRRVDFSPFLPLFPILQRSSYMTGYLVSPTFYFTVIAFAYFLASDVSFSLGIGAYIWAVTCGVLATFGVSAMGGGYYHANVQKFFACGAFVGMLFTIIYTGRRYYGAVFRRSLFLRSTDEVESHVVWGARVFILSCVVFTGSLVFIGLDWPLAVLYTAGVVMIFLVMGRVVAETGLFFMQPCLMPGGIMIGILGAKAVGPQALLVMSMLSVVLLLDPREALMPFMVNAFKIAGERGVRLGRTAAFCVAALVLGLAIALPVTLWFQYSRGMNRSDRWATRSAPTMHINGVVKVQQRLRAQANLEEARSLSGLGRLGAVSPARGALVTFAVGLVLVLLFAAARLRVVKWPFHPVMFVTMYSYAMNTVATSFLVGWLIKVAVVKYGGEASYRKLKPFMFGAIAGDMLGGVTSTLIGLIYYWFTGGEIPKTFAIMPA